MKELQTMMASHPHAMGANQMLGDDAQMIALCGQICTSCADACLAEHMLTELVRCIRLNLDCADICAATARILTRQTQTNSALLRDSLTACATACRVCAEECDHHASMEHCRICAKHCHECAGICEKLLQAVPEVA